MKQTSIRDLLYETPGPAARKKIRVWTGVALAAIAALIALIVRQFAETGQLAE